MDTTDYTSDTCNEPMTAPTVTDVIECEEPDIPNNVDFGYPRTLNELKIELHESVAEPNDPTKWMTSEEFWTEMRQDLPWL